MVGGQEEGISELYALDVFIRLISIVGKEGVTDYWGLAFEAKSQGPFLTSSWGRRNGGPQREVITKSIEKGCVNVL